MANQKAQNQYDAKKRLRDDKVKAEEVISHTRKELRRSIDQVFGSDNKDD